MQLRRSSRVVGAQASSSLPRVQKTTTKKTRATANATKAKATSKSTTSTTSAKAKPSSPKKTTGAATKRAAATTTTTKSVKGKKPAAAPPPPKRKPSVGGPTRQMEQELWSRGYRHVVGVDEAGRGPLAGPVVAAACVLPPDHLLLPSLPEGVFFDDSKKMTEEQREAAYEALVKLSEETTGRESSNSKSFGLRPGSGVRWACTVVPASGIDETNILAATMRAMDASVANVTKQVCGAPRGSSAAERGGPGSLVAAPGDPLAVLVDGNRLPDVVRFTAEMTSTFQSSLAASSPGAAYSFHARAVVKGDSKCTAIAAASVIAKVTRDRIMKEAAKQWPEYSFEQHKGYGTAAHVAAIRRHGPCPIHRRTFEPIKSMVAARGREGGR